MKVVIASNNAGKIREFKALLKHFPLEFIPQADLGIDDAEETGLTFVENAIIKARHASRLTGLPAIADDSGLAVDALLGAPGIYSARYAGAKANAKENIDKLLHQLIHVAPEKRQASYHCALVFITHENDPTPLICQGKWDGFILQQEQGNDGFGYDPIFYVPTEKMSAAELPLALKNQISHRGLALASLLNALPEKI